MMALPQNYRQIAPLSGSPQRLRASGGPGSGSSKEVANQSPFITNPYGNQAFHPQKISKNVNDIRIPKPPKPPEKPLMPHMRYSRKMWDQVKMENPDKKMWKIGRIIKQMWRELPEEVKTEYFKEYEVNKLEYEKKMKIYESSPAYLAYLATKTKGRLKDVADDGHEKSLSGSKPPVTEKRIDIQPAEDEDDMDDGLSAKHVAYARYMRNHRLISEIFSDSLVPDVRSVVTTTRMQILKRQVQSLTMHQKKLEGELQMIEDKFKIKKAKFLESSVTFNDALKKQCEKVIDGEMFEKLIQEQMEILRKERNRLMASSAPVSTVASNDVTTPPSTTPSSVTTAPAPPTVLLEVNALTEKKPPPEPIQQQSAAPPVSPVDEPSVENEKISAPAKEQMPANIAVPAASAYPIVSANDDKDIQSEVLTVAKEPVVLNKTDVPPLSTTSSNVESVHSTPVESVAVTQSSEKQATLHPTTPSSEPLPPPTGLSFQSSDHNTGSPNHTSSQVPPISSVPSMHPVSSQTPSGDSAAIHSQPPPITSAPPPIQSQNAYPASYAYPSTSQPLPPRPPRPQNYPQASYTQYPPQAQYENTSSYPPYNNPGHTSMHSIRTPTPYSQHVPPAAGTEQPTSPVAMEKNISEQ